MVGGEVTFSQIAGIAGLIIQAVVRLRTVADVGGVAVVERIVEAAVIAPLVEGTWNRQSRLSGKAVLLCQYKLVVSGCRFGQRLTLALALYGKKAEELVFHERTAYRSTEELAAIVWALIRRRTIPIGYLLRRLECCLAEVSED